MFLTAAPYQQYFDADGSPLDAGFVYFGQPNQNPETAPIAVYWDEAGTQPASQPVFTLNGYTVRSGTPSALFSAGDYSVSVKNRRGSLVAYNPSTASYIAQLANQTDPTKGSALIGYKAPFTGSVGRTLSTKLSETVSVKDFGAKGDGVTDDTAAISACIAACPGNVINFPPGTYITTGNHTLLTGQYIVGSGKNVTIISNSSTTSDTFKIPSSFCGISDLTITGTTSRTAGIHVNATGAPSHTYLTRLSMFNFADAGVKLNGVVQYVEDLDISIPTTTTGSGILITDGGDQYLSGISFDGGISPAPKCFAGLQITKSGGVWCSDSDFIHPQNGVVISATNVITQFMFFHNVACDTCSNNGWLISTSGTGTINSCAFSQCWGASSTNVGLLVSGVANSINGLTFTNARFIANGSDGVYLQSGVSNVVFSGGLISGNSLSPTLTSAGFHIGPNINDVSINGMRIGPSGSSSDTQLQQILVNAGTGNRISIVGCDLQTANTPMSFAATGTNNTVSACTGISLKGRVAATTDASGHITVTHNNGFALGTILATMQNDTAAVFAQWSGVSTSTGFQLKFFGSGGAALASTAVNFSWIGDL